MALPPDRVEKMVRAYGYSLDDFRDYLTGQKSPEDPLQECQAILEALPPEQLRIVHGILRQFTSQK